MSNGKGGSYIITEDGKRELVERTSDPAETAADHLPDAGKMVEPAPAAPESSAAAAPKGKK